MRIGTPRLHLRQTDSTNLRARELAIRGAPHGTLVTASEQTSGRGRQGRTWTAPRGRALLCSVIVRDPPRLLPLIAGVAVAEVIGDAARLKWPNDVLVEGRKVAGILVEGRLQERWAVLGIGINVALRPEDFPPELRDTAGTLGLAPPDTAGTLGLAPPDLVPAATSTNSIEIVLGRLLAALGGWLEAEDDAVLAAVRARDTLLGQPVAWSNYAGIGAGIDDRGRLLVATDAGVIALDAGEVHLTRAPPARSGR